MLLTITTTHQPATDLGYLLYKHPTKVQTFELSFGQGHVFYTEATEGRCTAALLLDVNPVQLVRGDNRYTLSQYVNDRPYAASSFLSVAIADVYRTALQGRSKDRQALADTPIPLQATMSVVPSRGGETLLNRLFAALGYKVKVERHFLDETFPDWGMSVYYTLSLEGTVRLCELLAHLYVLIPVLDDDKHYYVGESEVEKLLKRGDGWLAAHPERDLIVNRYLKHRRGLSQAALARLVVEESLPNSSSEDAEEAAVEEQLKDAKVSLHDQRLGAVLAILKDSGAAKVLDLGCGEGRLLKRLMGEKQFTRILGMDVSHQSLEIAAERLKLDRISERTRERIDLIHGSLMYRDERLAGFDAAAIVEVIEHLDAPRLAAFERVVFEFARPQVVIITTPNAEYNVMWEALPAGQFRHRDHRFEWTRAEFQVWATGISKRFGYRVRFLPIGPEDEKVGSPSQMGVFELLE